jgi:hypothetical protein
MTMYVADCELQLPMVQHLEKALHCMSLDQEKIKIQTLKHDSAVTGLKLIKSDYPKSETICTLLPADEHTPRQEEERPQGSHGIKTYFYYKYSIEFWDGKYFIPAHCKDSSTVFQLAWSLQKSQCLPVTPPKSSHLFSSLPSVFLFDFHDLQFHCNIGIYFYLSGLRFSVIIF